MTTEEVKELCSKYKWHCNACYGAPIRPEDGCWTNDRRQKFSCKEGLGGWESQKPKWIATKEIKSCSVR
jgi:hypothetical protein